MLWEIKSRWVQTWQLQCWLRCPFAKWQYHDISSHRSSAKMNQLMAGELLFCSGKHYRKSCEESISGFNEHGINQEYTGKYQTEIGVCQLRHVFLSAHYEAEGLWIHEETPSTCVQLKTKLKGVKYCCMASTWLISRVNTMMLRFAKAAKRPHLWGESRLLQCVGDKTCCHQWFHI